MLINQANAIKKIKNQLNGHRVLNNYLKVRDNYKFNAMRARKYHGAHRNNYINNRSCFK